MREIHKILVPVDFSEHSRRALEEAIVFAKTFGAELHLLHCYQLHPTGVEPYGIVTPETFVHDLRMAAFQRLSEWRDKVIAHGIRVQEHITAHYPPAEIVAMAERLGIDLIVMGTRGLSGFKHVLFGSVAERTIRTAPCPVLTVGHGGVDDLREIHKILVPVDFSEHSKRALDEAIGLAKVFHAELHLLHCYQITPGAISPYGIAVPETYEYEVRTAVEKRLSEWRDKARAQKVTAQEHITAHYPPEEIVAMAERLGIDLIVMGTRGLSGFKHVLLGSVAERTIRLAPCPVLTLKIGGDE